MLLAIWNEGNHKRRGVKKLCGGAEFGSANVMMGKLVICDLLYGNDYK
jgi:hypothetical protein